MTAPRFTLVAIHAHPDDESLLTGGTLARYAAEGHRVVLVVATLGGAGGSGERRRAELHAAATVLGCARVVELGYRDSGLHAEAAGDGGPRFVDVPANKVGERLAAILRAENADVLLGYDERGGYGHPDHVHVHRAARLAAAATGVRLLEATIDRRSLRLALAPLWLAGRLMPRLPLSGAADVFTPHEQLTHAVDVRLYARQKRAALRAHASQATGDGLRTVRLLGGLPLPLFRLILGREWYVEPGRAPGKPVAADVFQG